MSQHPLEAAHANTASPMAVTLARSVATTVEQRRAAELLTWARALRAIRDSDAAAGTKARRALGVTRFSTVTDQVRLIGARVAELVWTDRSWSARLGGAGVLVATVASGGQSAGIAALGTAVGVPLWLVLGAGGTFLGTFIDELEKLLQP